MILFGDVHNLIYNYKEILKQHVKNGQTESIILGDVGIGFPQSVELDTSDIPGNHFFIRGNHDNPFACSKHPMNLGDYGILKGDWCEDHHYEKLFYCAGAWSIDQVYRTCGLTWWPEEELDYLELTRAISFYKQQKPDIVISHDCPYNVLLEMYIPLGSSVIQTRTGMALEQMFDYHKPSKWIFGHHHTSWKQTIQGTEFICLKELETYII